MSELLMLMISVDCFLWFCCEQSSATVDERPFAEARTSYICEERSLRRVVSKTALQERAYFCEKTIYGAIVCCRRLTVDTLYTPTRGSVTARVGTILRIALA
jgi:hypothetical protein